VKKCCEEECDDREQNKTEIQNLAIKSIANAVSLNPNYVAILVIGRS
jgi:hypothetical protein